MTEDVAIERNLKQGEICNTPAHHPDINSPDQLKEKVLYLRKLTGGVPIGSKIGCNIEKDIEILANSQVDFIAIDGFGGGTGGTDCHVRDNVGLPILAALPRARTTLESLGVKDNISLIAGGGLRKSSDFAKCLALGADAIYIGTAALIAINCEQYRICHTGFCPTGITTHDPKLLTHLNVEKGIERLCNFIRISTEEISNFARIVGKNDITRLDTEDLISLNKDVAEITSIKWMNGKFISK